MESILLYFMSWIFKQRIRKESLRLAKFKRLQEKCCFKTKRNSFVKLENAKNSDVCWVSFLIKLQFKLCKIPTHIVVGGKTKRSQ